MRWKRFAAPIIWAISNWQKLDANRTKINWINTIDQYEAAHQPVVQTPAAKVSGGAPAKAAPAAPVRRRVTISIQEVTDESWQINNAAELDAYIESCAMP